MSGEKKRVREKFRTEVFTRDRYTCCACGAKNVPLDAHHIVNRNQMPNGGYELSNGITLCNVPGGCHEKAEVFHSTGKAYPGYSPEDLAALISQKRTRKQ